ncbi:[FeFe] hydrogenase H-cluster maturation GTPase HydF [Pseudodesulfovibrio portus]|uniref:[FeFe] hydrogenase H-cluster maturation GTPase HydF n=1 Tax=Pseudodesulfovibrio portus TaxID=231439 RepID=A0ABM8AQ35_9BACT|nr:[FeFe] hydrogenase H-cluster maturation GTPase HydF [Pseudodesulfovibrio portus]BDQ33512.1 [FeFe] hydrogenase H-cluster maturation GTPase HydF [Pseudodesulfovibrio portus]
MSNKAPRGVRLVIALAGRRNAGKSSLINALTGQDTAIVSDTPGTTTDPVAKHYELLPLGPVTFYDTAGLDDTGELGELRVKATRKVLYRCDVAVVVLGEEGLTEYEHDLLEAIREMNVPHIIAWNKADLRTGIMDGTAILPGGEAVPLVHVSAVCNTGVDRLKQMIIDSAPPEYRQERLILGDMISGGDLVLCVVPIDLAAPKGRLILPQVQVLREILDCDAVGVTVKEREIQAALDGFREKPALVVTDSQVVMSVAGDVPDDIPMTTFSTLFARYKGDLDSLVRGASAIDDLKDGDTVLIGEACSHHNVADDIGRVKIPRWMGQYTGRDLRFEVYSGHDFPEDLERFSLVVHCGACMLNRTEMLRRITECGRREVPVTNYGVCISKLQGLLPRVLRPLGVVP